MSGVYLHIPYCKQVCYYCDFHFRTNMRDKDAMIAAMQRELALRKDYLRDTLSGGLCRASTLYFGGGTPSALSLHDLDSLLVAVYRHYDFDADAELTIEANPDDLTDEFLAGLRSMGFNRLSIGVQSFFDDDLQRMNRRHNAETAITSVKRAQDKGFNNINVDLIYGLPSMNLERWKHNIVECFKLNVPHLSAYHLTIEDRTVFGVRRKRGAVFSMPEEDSVAQYHLLLDMTAEAGYEHYEISNFARIGAYSRHNSAYWRLVPYIGIGPSAHSYDGRSRQWNICRNADYIHLINSAANGNPDAEWFEREELSASDSFNDYILTGLRTRWGVDALYIARRFGEKKARTFDRQAADYLRQGLMRAKAGVYTLSREGQLLCDRITSDLFESE